MKDLKDLMRTRRTIHQYLSAPVEEELVLEALELATWAPNHKMTQPWRFTLAGSQSRSALAEVAVELKAQSATTPLTLEMKQAVRSKFLEPARLVILSMPLAKSESQRREDYASIAAGLQNAALYLWSRQVGCKWSTGAPTRHPKTYAITGIQPELEEILGFFWIGRFDSAPPPPPRSGRENFIRRLE